MNKVIFLLSFLTLFWIKSSGQFSQLSPSDVVATVDLTNARAGLRVFPLTADHVSVPLGSLTSI